MELGREMQHQTTQKQEELFFTEGTQQLVVARYTIAYWSLRKAKERIAVAKQRRADGHKVCCQDCICEHSDDLAG